MVDHTMIERVARAIMPRAWDNDGPMFDAVRTQAVERSIAAIQAMREPSKAMLDAVQLDPYDDPMVSRGMNFTAWVEMIDAALRGD